MTEQIDHPRHYQRGGLEAITVIEAWDLGFSLGSAVKYICRAGSKTGDDPCEALRKAAWYCLREAGRIEAARSTVSTTADQRTEQRRVEDWKPWIE